MTLSCAVGIYGCQRRVWNEFQFPVAVLWVRASDLTATVAGGGTVNEWPTVDGQGPPAVSATTGTGALPTLVVNDGPVHVRFNDTASEANGGFADFGPLSIPVASRGLTGMMVMRFRNMAASTWARLFDFVSTAGFVDDLNLSQWASTAGIWLQDRNAGFVQSDGASDTWMFLAFRFSPRRGTLRLQVGNRQLQ